jgi:hypothetical protein
MLAPILVALLAGLSSAYTIISYSDNNCQVRIRTVAESTGVSARYWIISDNALSVGVAASAGDASSWCDAFSRRSYADEHQVSLGAHGTPACAR